MTVHRGSGSYHPRNLLIREAFDDRQSLAKVTCKYNNLERRKEVGISRAMNRGEGIHRLTKDNSEIDNVRTFPPNGRSFCIKSRNMLSIAVT